MNRSNPTCEADPIGCFSTTHWSVVLKAREPGGEQSAASLEALCRTYYYPLYAYVRRRGHSPHDAEDLTQEFFAQLLSRPFLSNVAPEKGLFRSFLLASMNNFLANEWDRARTEKRGGRACIFSVDADTAESRYVLEAMPDQEADPEREYDRHWAIVVMETALAQLEVESVDSGKGALFRLLRDYLQADPQPGDYTRLASCLKWSQGAVAVAVHRLRTRYRQLLAEAVAQTLVRPEEIEAEMERLLVALRAERI